jgi:hypothetical protein
MGMVGSLLAGDLLPICKHRASSDLLTVVDPLADPVEVDTVGQPAHGSVENVQRQQRKRKV